jgi:hypothetical protein
MVLDAMNSLMTTGLCAPAFPKAKRQNVSATRVFFVKSSFISDYFIVIFSKESKGAFFLATRFSHFCKNPDIAAVN